MCYAHTDGDAWDYLCVEPVTEAGQRRLCKTDSMRQRGEKA